jgi:histidine ammonia-lyase
MALRYPAAALAAALRQLAAPASLDVPPLDQSIEDHSTGAPAAVRRTEEALDVLAGTLAVTGTGRHRLGAGTAAAVAALREAVSGAADRSPAAIHRLVRDVIVPRIAVPGRRGTEVSGRVARTGLHGHPHVV